MGQVGAHKHAVLMLSSVNLPGGQQRIRTYEDQLQMRTFFQEHDLISVSCDADALVLGENNDFVAG